MKTVEWRHPYPQDVPMERLLDTLPEGTGISVYQIDPFWDVVARRRKGTKTVVEFFVTESHPAGKPIRITEPVTKQSEAIEQAKLLQQMWRITHCQAPEWPWE